MEINYCFTHRYDPQLCLQIAHYTSLHGTSAAATYYTKKLGHRIQNSTVNCIKSSYQDELNRIRASGSSEPLNSLLHKKQGIPVLLGDKIDGISDGMVKAYIKSICKVGGSVSSQVVIAAAHGILTSLDETKLQEFGGHVDLTMHLVHSFLTQMNYVQRKGTTAKSRFSKENFAKRKRELLEGLRATVGMEKILPELILNWDQTGIKLVPSTDWTMEEQGARRVELVG